MTSSTTSPSALIDEVNDLLSDTSVAGVAVNSNYKSSTLTVTPPAGSLTDRGKETLAGFFKLPDGRDAVTIDSWGSQANRFEKGIEGVAEKLGYPLLSVELDGSVHSNSLRWSHRQADAQFRLVREAFKDAGIDTDAIQSATVADAEALLRSFPAAVVYGWWDSHTAPKAGAAKKTSKKVSPEVIDAVEGWGAAGAHRRSSRAVTSEIVAQGVHKRNRFAARLTTYGAIGKDYSDLGLGTIPPQQGPIDVTYDEIVGKGFISLAYLRRFGFGAATQEGQSLATVLALIGFVTSDADLHLRTGAELILKDRTITIERNGAEATEFVIPALDVLIEAARTLGANFGWGDNAAVTVEATKAYRDVIAAASSHAADDSE